MSLELEHWPGGQMAGGLLKASSSSIMQGAANNVVVVAVVVVVVPKTRWRLYWLQRPPTGGSQESRLNRCTRLFHQHSWNINFGSVFFLQISYLQNGYKIYTYISTKINFTSRKYPNFLQHEDRNLHINN